MSEKLSEKVPNIFDKLFNKLLEVAPSLFFIGIIVFILYLWNGSRNLERKWEFYSYICNGIVSEDESWITSDVCHEKLLEIEEGDYYLTEKQKETGLVGELTEYYNWSKTHNLD